MPGGGGAHGEKLNGDLDSSCTMTLYPRKVRVCLILL